MGDCPSVGCFVKRETTFSSQGLPWVRKGESSLEPDAKKACFKLVLDLTSAWLSLNDLKQGVLEEQTISRGVLEAI